MEAEKAWKCIPEPSPNLNPYSSFPLCLSLWPNFPKTPSTMFRVPLRRLRPAAPSSVAKQQLQVSTRRTLFTKTEKKGTWRGTALRWGLAGGAVYWYNTSPMFADDAPRRCFPTFPQSFPGNRTANFELQRSRAQPHPPSRKMKKQSTR